MLYVFVFFFSIFLIFHVNNKTKTKTNWNQIKQSDIDECSGGPCEHGGTCIDLVGGFRCECPPEWTGDVCDIGKCHCVDNMIWKSVLMTVHQVWSILASLKSKWQQSQNQITKSHAWEFNKKIVQFILWLTLFFFSCFLFTLPF